MKKSIATLIAATALITLPSLASAAPSHRGNNNGNGYQGNNKGNNHGQRYTAPAPRAPRYTPPTAHRTAPRGPAYRGPAYRGPAYRGPAYGAPVYRAPVYRPPVVHGAVYRRPIYHPAPIVTRPVLKRRFCMRHPGHPACYRRAHTW